MTSRAEQIVAKIDLRHLATQLLGEPTGSGPSQKWPSPDMTLSQTGATPPMSVFVGRDGKQRFTCFSSGIRGDAIDLVRQVKNMTVAESMSFLENWAGGSALASSRPWSPPRPIPTKVATATELADVMRAARAELQKRPCDEAREWLAGHGLDRASAIAAGFGAIENGTVPTCKYPIKSGAVLPNFSVAGELTGLQIRLLTGGNTKYLNVAGTYQTGVSFHRPPGDHVFARSIAICEGVVDAAVMAKRGIPTVAVLSTSRVTESVSEIASAAKGRRAVIAFDGDKAGVTAQRHLAERLRSHGPVSEIALPAGQDIGTMEAASPRWLGEQLRMVSKPVPQHQPVSL